MARRNNADFPVLNLNKTRLPLKWNGTVTFICIYYIYEYNSNKDLHDLNLD